MTRTINEIYTERFGTLVVDEDDLIRIVEPMPGLDGLDVVVLVPVDEDGIFVWVQSAAPPDVAFLAVNPFLFHPDYQVDVDDGAGSALGSQAGDEMIVYTLVTIRGSIATTNLAAPLIVNARTRRAMQLILDGWPLRAPLDTTGATGSTEVQR
jgi:flagellar assembly factor FliW